MKLSLLEAQKITKTFTQGTTTLTVFRDLDCSFMQTHTYALTGVSGAGKSTLLHILAGIETPTQGLVVFNQKALTSYSSQEQAQLLNRSFGLVFQSPYLINELSVLENIIIPGLIAGRPHHECMLQAEELLRRIHLEDKALASPAFLSGGQQQRIAIMRALFNKPAFLFADEPTGNLDEKTGLEIINFLLECQQEWGMGLIISTHDTYVSTRMDHTFVLHNGNLVPN